MSITITNRIDKIVFLINGIVNSYLLIDQNLKLLTPILYDEKVYSKWDYSEGVDGVAAMRMALYSHILSDIRAIMLDSGPHVASIQNVIKAIKDPSVVKQLKQNFCQPNEVIVLEKKNIEEKKWLIQVLQKEDVKRKDEAFEEILTKLVEDYHTLKKSDLGIRVNTARNKMISHKQVTSASAERKLYDAKDFGLKFRDAIDIVEASSDIIFGAYALITRSSFDTKSFTNHHELVAENFWGRKNA